METLKKTLFTGLRVLNSQLEINRIQMFDDIQIKETIPSINV